MYTPNTKLVPLDSSTQEEDSSLRSRGDKRRAQEWRVHHLKAMRTQLETLELIAVAARVVPDADEIWDDFIEDDTKRLRGFLRRVHPLNQELTRLTQEKNELQRVQTEYGLSTVALSTIVEEAAASADWEAKTRAWRVLTRQYYRPWTAEQLNGALTETLTSTNTSKPRVTSTRSSFSGWIDVHLTQPTLTSVGWSMAKVFTDADVDTHVATIWLAFSETAAYLDKSALHFAEQYDTVSGTVHNVYLLVRVESVTSTCLYVKALRDATLQRVLSKCEDGYTSNFFWTRWDILDADKPRSSTTFRTTTGGTFQFSDAAYLNRWRRNVLASAVRMETAMTRRSPFLESSSMGHQDSA